MQLLQVGVKDHMRNLAKAVTVCNSALLYTHEEKPHVACHATPPLLLVGQKIFNRLQAATTLVHALVLLADAAALENLQR
jgi:hypothetical protein